MIPVTASRPIVEKLMALLPETNCYLPYFLLYVSVSWWHTSHGISNKSSDQSGGVHSLTRLLYGPSYCVFEIVLRPISSSTSHLAGSRLRRKESIHRSHPHLCGVSSGEWTAVRSCNLDICRCLSLVFWRISYLEDCEVQGDILPICQCWNRPCVDAFAKRLPHSCFAHVFLKRYDQSQLPQGRLDIVKKRIKHGE